MTVLLAIIGTLNLAVGFGVGVYLGGTADRLPLRPHQLLSRIPYLGTGGGEFNVRLVDDSADAGGNLTVEGMECEAESAAADEENNSHVDVEHILQIPEDWLQILEEHGVEVDEVVEATAEVIRLKIDDYRGRLIRIDGGIRRELANRRTNTTQIVSEIEELNREWLEEQQQARESLIERAKKLGDKGAVADKLRSLLDEQIARLDKSLAALARYSSEKAQLEVWQKILESVTSSFDDVHALRDAILTTLVEIKLLDQGCESFTSHLLKDDLTSLKNRGGLEKLFVDLYADDPHRQRQVSCVMLDIDKFRVLNLKYGPVFADRVIAAFGGLIDHLLPTDHGLEVAIRYAGQRFVAFLADTGPRTATSVAERMRQTIEVTTFEWQQHSLEITVSCGVAEFGPRDTTEMLYRRLEAAVRFAKTRGRNRTTLDDGNGPDIVDPPHYEVQGRVISLL